MAKGQATVSNEFAAFYGKSAVAIDEAKKAENSMSSGPCPVGWKGKCVLLEAAAEKGKDKKNEDGTTSEGNPRVKIKFGIVDDETYSGKTFTKYWIFFDSKNMTKMQRFEMFLNDMEKMGLPREVREKHETMQELFNYFVEGEFVFDVDCVTDNYADDKKKMVVVKLAEPVDTTTSMSPSGASDPTDKFANQTIDKGPETSTTTPSPEIAEGAKVKFLGEEWEVLGQVGEDRLKLFNSKTGRERDVPATACTVV